MTQPAASILVVDDEAQNRRLLEARGDSVEGQGANFYFTLGLEADAAI